MNNGRMNFLINLKQLQEIDTEEEKTSNKFYEKHKEKIKLIYWLTITSLTILTLESIAHELASKYFGK